MANQQIMQPRFSVRSSFKGNQIDASDGRYATKAGQNKLAQPSSKQCYAANDAAQPKKPVQGQLRDVTKKTQTREERAYLMSKTVVASGEPAGPADRRRMLLAKRAEQQSGNKFWNNRQVSKGQREVTEAPRPPFLKHAADRSIAAQKMQRNRIRSDVLRVSVPASEFKKDEFILEVPVDVDIKDVEVVVDEEEEQEQDKQEVVKVPVARQMKMPLEADTGRDYRRRHVADDTAHRNQDTAYYKSKNVVAQPSKPNRFACKND